MNNFTFNHDGRTYTRVNKRKAETLIIQGKTIICTPSNLRPFGVWGVDTVVNKETLNAQYNYKKVKSDKNILHYYFTQFCNSFEFYNCTAETGKYINFYVEL